MLLSILLVFNFLVGETYYVLQLKGKIVNVETNQVLKTGDKLTPDTKLKFSTADAKAILISSARGRFIISPSAASKKAGNSEITEFVKNVLLSHDDDYRFMSTRGVDAPTDKADLESYFGVGKFYVIGEEIKVKIDNEKYKITPKKYFIIRYKNQTALIDKKILIDGDVIKLAKEQLFLVNGKELSQEAIKKMDLYFYDEATKYEEYITSFSIYYVPEKQLAEEFDIQIMLFKDQNLPKEEAKKELKAYFNYAYGNTDAAIFETYLDNKLATY
jgi:hypothetical protein